MYGYFFGRMRVLATFLVNIWATFFVNVCSTRRHTCRMYGCFFEHIRALATSCDDENLSALGALRLSRGYQKVSAPVSWLALIRNLTILEKFADDLDELKNDTNKSGCGSSVGSVRTSSHPALARRPRQATFVNAEGPSYRHL